MNSFINYFFCNLPCSRSVHNRWKVYYSMLVKRKVETCSVELNIKVESPQVWGAT